MDLLDSIDAETAGCCEEGCIRHDRRLHVRAFQDPFLTIERSQHAVREPIACVGHVQGRRALALLGLQDLVAAELYPHRQGFACLVGRLEVRDAAEEGQDRDAVVTADHGNVDVPQLILGYVARCTKMLRNECVGTADVECGNAGELLGIVRAMQLEDFGCGGDYAVDGVGDDGHECIRAMLSDSIHQGLDRLGIDLNGDAIKAQDITAHVLPCSAMQCNARRRVDGFDEIMKIGAPYHTMS
mmetsp:Transcript_12017/g.33077  ORF Transcript_12017/g.33077 Transcript_12017/m.33077 type:complete len:242 (+) Transcript_12017:1174-1899(+)